MPNRERIKKLFYHFSFLLCAFQIVQAQNGIVKSYYNDGVVQSEASYVNDVLDGAYKTYFPNGKTKLEKNYSQGILDGYVREYYPNALMKEEYFVKLGVKDGSHRIYFEDGQLKELISYSEGILTSRHSFVSENNKPVSTDLASVEKKHEIVSVPTELIGKKPELILPAKETTENKQETVLQKNESEIKMEVADLSSEIKPEVNKEVSLPEAEEEILCDVQVCPVPIGGMKGIYKKLIYPDQALLSGLEGIVTIIATIDAKGDVIKTQVLKKLGLGCDEAAQEVLRKTKFIPGENNGIDVETNATINIEFKILNRKPVQ